MPFHHARVRGSILDPRPTCTDRPADLLTYRTYVRWHEGVLAVRSQHEVELVLGLVRDGFNDCEIARTTGVPRSTVREWRHGLNFCLPRPRRKRAGQRSDGVGRHDCVSRHDFSQLPPAAYSYLLGVYLGDGCVSAAPRAVWKLRLAMDAAYSQIIEESCAAMEAVVPGKRANCYKRPAESYVEVSMYWKHWPCLIPQHGPGRKHLRPIVLTSWQEEIVQGEREALIRGLIHSDGCRIVANDRGVASIRYHFSNLSEDIKKIFCESLDDLGIPWTRPCDRQIAIYRKSAVAILDTFVGPKR
jgi:hypothetical protein